MGVRKTKKLWGIFGAPYEGHEAEVMTLLRAINERHTTQTGETRGS